MNDPTSLPPPRLECFRVEAEPPRIVGAESKRAWMDATSERFAYRCTPMTIANASGWEILCPFAFEVEWDGTPAIEAITVYSTADGDRIQRLIASHFGHGILTMHPGWLFRTPPGWAVWARGSPNAPKDGITALEGLIETDWLPFTFTMNWRFTRPGRVRFEKDEPFCFITLAPHAALDAVTPTLHELTEDPQLQADYAGWQQSRADFNARLRQRDDTAVKQGWQRTYIQAGGGAPERGFHVTKRRLPNPKR